MSERYQGKYKNGTNRLRYFDYGTSASYFITICVRNNRKIFGEIIGNQMILSELGKIAASEWLRTGEIRKSMNLQLFDFVVMPDHFHAIIHINSNEHNIQFQPNQFGVQSQNIGSVIRGFKAAVTTYARKNNILFDWQPRYHDRIIRDPFELERIRKYIQNNVVNWKSQDQDSSPK